MYGKIKGPRVGHVPKEQKKHQNDTEMCVDRRQKVCVRLKLQQTRHSITVDMLFIFTYVKYRKDWSEMIGRFL